MLQLNSQKLSSLTTYYLSNIFETLIRSNGPNAFPLILKFFFQFNKIEETANFSS